MPRPRRSVVIVCIAALALASFLPGGPVVECAALEPAWILLPDLASTPCHMATLAAPEQLQRLQSRPPSRAPPGKPLA